MKKTSLVVLAITLSVAGVTVLVIHLLHKSEPTISIALQKKTFEYGEDIVATLRISNPTEETLTILRPEMWWSPKDLRNTLEFEVTEATFGRLGRISHTLAGKIGVEPQGLALQPGESSTSRASLFRTAFQMGSYPPHKAEENWREGANFSYVYQEGRPEMNDRFLKPGRYTVRAVYQVNDPERMRAKLRNIGSEIEGYLPTLEDENVRSYWATEVERLRDIENFWDGKAISNAVTFRVIPVRNRPLEKER